MVAGMPARMERAGLRIDRVVAAVAITALTLSITIFGRMVADRVAGTNLSSFAGISLLAPDDQLVTFEDFELGAPGWDMSPTDQPFRGMLGPFGNTNGDEAVSRVYDLPGDAGFAEVTLDIHAVGDWALEDVILYANGVEVLRQNFTSSPDQRGRQRALVPDQDWVRATVMATGDQTVTVKVLLARPQDQLRLGFGAMLEATGPQWAIDNLRIVTSDVQPRS